jgi:hypothetical protein
MICSIFNYEGFILPGISQVGKCLKNKDGNGLFNF